MATGGYNGRRWRRLRLAVLERDGWRCAYCSAPIDPAAPTGTAWAPSVDHVVEVSAGGGDVAGNLRACHVRCNTRKELERRAGRRYPARRAW